MDTLQRFLLTELNIRGQHVRLQEAWQAMIADRHYSPALVQLLGELTAVSVMLASGMKHRGKLTLQIQGSGPVTLLVVEVTHELKLRGMAKTTRAIEETTDLDALLGDGKIFVTLENTQTDTLYQSYVPREGKTISDAFQTFLTQSDQLATRLWLAANDTACAGLLIQRLPETDEKDSDAWDRISHLASTVKKEELLTLDAQTLLHRLFHEETVKLFPEEPVTYECQHDKQRIDTMLLNLGREEVEALLEQEGEIVIHNEMCNQHERYNKAQIEQLFQETEMKAQATQTPNEEAPN